MTSCMKMHPHSILLLISATGMKFNLVKYYIKYDLKKSAVRVKVGVGFTALRYELVSYISVWSTSWPR